MRSQHTPRVRLAGSLIKNREIFKEGFKRTPCMHLCEDRLSTRTFIVDFNIMAFISNIE